MGSFFRARTLVLHSALAVAVAACSDGAGKEARGVALEPIVHGSPSPDAQDYVILLYDAKAHFACTGTLVAPSLVLTARHCVTKVTSDSIACDENGNATTGGVLGDDYPPNDLEVHLGPTRARAFPAPDARGSKIVHDGSDNVCNHDVALLEIAPAITDVAPARLHLDSGPAPHDKLTVVGWGVSGMQLVSTSRGQRTGVPLLAIGPSTFDGIPVPSNDFLLGESICDGDSGAPAIAEATGAIVGVASFGSNGVESTASDPAASCVDKGKGVLNTFTSLAAFKPLVARALADSGAPHSN